MKKYLIILTVIMLAGLIAVPAFAEIEFKYGGMIRFRFDTQDNVFDGTNTRFSPFYNSDDNQRYIDQRTRFFFEFAASKNLKVVVKFIMGDAVWGDAGDQGSGVGNTGGYRGGNVGADAVSVAIRNAYVQFAVPGIPSTAIVGVQNLVLIDSWIIDDEFPAAVLETKLSPEFKLTLSYIGAQHGWERVYAPNNELPLTDQRFDIDTVFATLDYKQGPWSGSIVGLYQNAHNTDVSITPTSLGLRIRNFIGVPQINGDGSVNTSSFAFLNNRQPESNDLFDLGLNIQYKSDWLAGYVSFVKNFGGVDLKAPPNTQSDFPTTSANYTGWMIDAGLTYYRGPFTANIGGFYTTGPSISNDPAKNGDKFVGLSSSNVNWFTYPLATNKYFSEIIGGGILGDNYFTLRGYDQQITANNVSYYGAQKTVYWRGYGMPTNLWTLTTGGSWQIDGKTKLSGSYWYFGTAEDVPTQWDQNMFGGNGGYRMSSSIGHEFNLYLDRNIMDRLTLTFVGAYLLANDAFAPLPYGANLQTTPTLPSFNGVTKPLADDAWELGARLQWVF
jgi:hypothetical protein